MTTIETLQAAVAAAKITLAEAEAKLAAALVPTAAPAPVAPAKYSTRLKCSEYSGDGTWWLLDTGRDCFVDIGRPSAARGINERVDLLPGDYTLGCGKGRSAVRKQITV